MHSASLLQRWFIRHYWNACCEDHFFLYFRWKDLLLSCRFHYFALSFLEGLLAFYTLTQKLIILHSWLNDCIFRLLLFQVFLKLYEAIALTLVSIYSEVNITPALKGYLRPFFRNWEQLISILTVTCLEKQLINFLRSFQLILACWVSTSNGNKLILNIRILLDCMGVICYNTTKCLWKLWYILENILWESFRLFMLLLA